MSTPVIHSTETLRRHCRSETIRRNGPGRAQTGVFQHLTWRRKPLLMTRIRNSWCWTLPEGWEGRPGPKHCCGSTREAVLWIQIHFWRRRNGWLKWSKIRMSCTCSTLGASPGFCSRCSRSGGAAWWGPWRCGGWWLAAWCERGHPRRSCWDRRRRAHCSPPGAVPELCASQCSRVLREPLHIGCS